MNTSYNFQVILNSYSQTSEPVPNQRLRDEAALILPPKLNNACGRARTLLTGASCQRCEALRLCLNTKNTSLLPGWEMLLVTGSDYDFRSTVHEK